MSTQLREWLPEVRQIARQAGTAILNVYHCPEELQVDVKADDSPVTKADHAGHRAIVEGLGQLTPDIPILSEEGDLPAYAKRKAWGTYWLVDPLDGTKEFINRNGEFTVNVALIVGGEAVLGVVYVPVKDVMYSAAKGLGAYKDADGRVTKISVRKLPEGELVVVGSRRHGAEALERMLKRTEQRLGQIKSISMGSSLKICVIAEGAADWYPRLALTSEWDTAAAQAVLEEAGGIVVDAEHFETLKYNQKESILNPFFHVFADQSIDWAEIIALADH